MRSICLAAAGARQPVDAGEEVEVLADAQVAVERELLGHVTHASARGACGLVQVEPGHAGRPAVGRSRPHIILNVVDLPAPLGPSRPKISPRPMRKVIWSAAVKSPNLLVSPSASTTGAAACCPVDAASRTSGDSPLALPPEQVDEGILEPRRRRLDLERRPRPGRSRPAAGPPL